MWQLAAGTLLNAHPQRASSERSATLPAGEEHLRVDALGAGRLRPGADAPVRPQRRFAVGRGLPRLPCGDTLERLVTPQHVQGGVGGEPPVLRPVSRRVVASLRDDPARCVSRGVGLSGEDRHQKLKLQSVHGPDRRPGRVSEEAENGDHASLQDPEMARDSGRLTLGTVRGSGLGT